MSAQFMVDVIPILYDNKAVMKRLEQEGTAGRSIYMDTTTEDFWVFDKGAWRKMPKLTTMERAVFVGLREWHEKHGHMPTSKQLVHAIGWTTRGPLTATLRSLASKGVIVYRPRVMPVELL